MSFDRFLVVPVAALIAVFLPSTHSFIAPVGRTHRKQLTSVWESSVHKDEARSVMKSDLLSLLKETPSNAPTSRKLTRDILGKIDELEQSCPTPDDQVLEELGGNWDLLWTSQDIRSSEFQRNPFRSWIK